MNSYVRWRDIRTAHVERAGGEEAVEAGKRELLAAAAAFVWPLPAGQVGSVEEQVNRRREPFRP